MGTPCPLAPLVPFVPATPCAPTAPVVPLVPAIPYIPCGPGVELPDVAAYSAKGTLNNCDVPVMV